MKCNGIWVNLSQTFQDSAALHPSYKKLKRIVTPLVFNSRMAGQNGAQKLGSK
jgi:hypothetical protein